METRTLGQSGVAVVSVVGLGTWPMGGEWWGGADDEESIRTIHRALELGVTLFDTAEAYAAGHAEEVLGHALVGPRPAASGHRRQSGPQSLRARPDLGRLRRFLSPPANRLHRRVLPALAEHRSADRPGDGALERLRAAGQIRAIGVSNFTSDEMRSAGQYGRIDVLQPPYNMFWRFIEGDQLPYCQEHAIGIMAYSALAQGLLTGTPDAQTTFPDGDKRPTTVLFQPGNYEPSLTAVEALRPIAARTGLTLPQLAIAWLLRRPGVDAALVGARTVREIEENADGAPWQIDVGDLAAADAATRAVFESLPRVPDMFQNWANWELQRRRYEQTGQLPVGVTGE